MTNNTEQVLTDAGDEQRAATAEPTRASEAKDLRAMDARVAGILGWAGSPNDAPHYTTDVAADYMVLKRVRDTWDKEAKAWFVIAFCGVLSIRTGIDYSINGTVWLVLFGNENDTHGYRVGDYSRAALAVVNAQPSPLAPASTPDAPG